MSLTADADVLSRLADEVRRLTIDRRDPEAFFVKRSEIAHELRALARTNQDRPKSGPNQDWLKSEAIVTRAPARIASQPTQRDIGGILSSPNLGSLQMRQP